MKRLGILVLGLFVAASVVTSGIALARDNAATRSPADVDKTPPVVLPGNADKAPGQLLQGEQLNRVPPADAKLIKKQLIKWADAEALMADGSTPWVAPDRQVWLIQVYYPNGTETKVGLIPNALVTEVMDAETGQSIVTKVERLQTAP